MFQVDRENFRVDTPDLAAWTMRKYRSLAQKAARNDEIAKAEHDRIDAWHQRVTQRIAGDMEFFSGHLEAYAMRERAENRKSVDLPDGVIRTRIRKAGIAPDKSTFVQWALEHERHDLLRVSYAPDMDAITSTVVVDGGTVLDPGTGEVIPGLAPTPEVINVTITPDLTAVDIDDMEEDDE